MAHGGAAEAAEGGALLVHALELGGGVALVVGQRVAVAVACPPPWGMAFAIPTTILKHPAKITILSHCFFTTTNSRWHASMGMFHILSNVLISNASL